jgi:hypothetical protein
MSNFEVNFFYPTILKGEQKGRKDKYSFVKHALSFNI